MLQLGRTVKLVETAALASLSKYAPFEGAKKAARKAFASKLVELRGVPLKISQILACSQDEERASVQKEALQKLEPMPLDIIAGIIQNDAPELWSKITEISETGIPASLGQVHRVVLKDGRECALKVQYPDIHPQMDFDQMLVCYVSNYLTHTFSK